MNTKLWKLLFYSVSTDLIGVFIAVFLNLYIWKQGKSITDLAWFNLSTFLIWMLAYAIGAWVLHRTSMRVVFQIANGFAVALFLTLLFFPTDDKWLWIVTIGACTGMMKGFLSSGKTFGISAFGGKAEFNTYFQYQALAGSMLQIAAPLLFATLFLVLSYKAMFTLMSVYSITLMFVTLYVPNNPKSEMKEPLFKDFLSPFRSAKMKWLSLSYLLGGIFSEFQSVFLVVFTFQLTESNFGVALLNIAYSVLILILIQLNRRLGNVNGVQWLFAGATVAFIGFGMIMFLPQAWLLVANFFVVTGNFYFSTTYYGQQFEVISELSGIHKERMLIWREGMLCFARVLFLSFVVTQGPVDKEAMSHIFLLVIGVTLFVPFVHHWMTHQKEKILSLELAKHPNK